LHNIWTQRLDGTASYFVWYKYALKLVVFIQFSRRRSKYRTGSVNIVTGKVEQARRDGKKQSQK